MKITTVKAFRLSGVLLGLIYLYWGFTQWDMASRTRHPILSTTLTFIYAILLLAPWTQLLRLRYWAFLYGIFVLFSLWMIIAHAVGLLAAIAQPQIALIGILAMLIVEISQIPVLLIMKAANKGVQRTLHKVSGPLTPDVRRD
jgi:hypothetical protein